MTTTLPSGPRSHRRLIAALLAVAVLLGGGVAWAIARPGHSGTPTPPAVVLDPVLETVGTTIGKVPWDKPLGLTVRNGSLRTVSVTDPDGLPFPGEVTDQGWSSAADHLLPSSTYTVLAIVADSEGHTRSVPLTAHTTPPARTLRVVLSPGDGKVVGVGMPVIATLNQTITSQADRAAIEARLTVTAVPPVAGAWRWMSPSELHYRGPDYWAAGSEITAAVDFKRLQLSGGTWGSGQGETHYSIGRKLIATVDVTAHDMKVVQDGVLLRTVKVSTGRDKYPTKGGVHLVLEKTKLKIMDSATVGIPRKSPDGYYEKVPNSVRISYGGAFVHSADWSVRDQGVRNVSHGCVNISPADAAWFFDLVKRGDVVDIIHANAPPKLSDPGMSDWNIPFAEWPS